MPGGPARRVLFGAVAAILTTGVVGAALVGGGSSGPARSSASKLGAGSPAARPSESVDATTATQPTTAVTPAPAAANPAGGGAEGPFWGVLLASFPNTPAGVEVANTALTAARAADPQASVIHSDTYSSLRRGYVVVVSAHLASRTAALTEVGRLRQAGFPDANARCITAGPACP